MTWRKLINPASVTFTYMSQSYLSRDVRPRQVSESKNTGFILVIHDKLHVKRILVIVNVL